jgi:hypothetical protein
MVFSTTHLRGFAPIRGVLPEALRCKRCLAQRPVEALPFPGDALDPVVIGKAGLPDAQKEAVHCPDLEPAVGETGATERARQRHPLDASSKNVHDSLAGFGAMNSSEAACVLTKPSRIRFTPRHGIARVEREDRGREPPLPGELPRPGLAHHRNPENRTRLGTDRTSLRRGLAGTAGHRLEEIPPQALPVGAGCLHR